MTTPAGELPSGEPRRAPGGVSRAELVFNRKALEKVQQHHAPTVDIPLSPSPNGTPHRSRHQGRSKSGGPAKRFRSAHSTTPTAARRSLTGRSGNTTGATLPSINPPTYTATPHIAKSNGYASATRRPTARSSVPPAYIRSRSRNSTSVSQLARADAAVVSDPLITATRTATYNPSAPATSAAVFTSKQKEKTTSVRRSRTAELPQMASQQRVLKQAAGAPAASGAAAPGTCDTTGGVGWTVDRAGMSRGKGNKLQWFGPPGEVVPGLWVGSMEHASPKYVDEAGFTTIFSIMRYSVFGGPPVYPEKVEFHNYPFCDNGTDIIPFSEIANKIHESLTRGMRVLVHCKQGISRSVSSVMAYLYLFRNMKFEQSLAAVRSVRPAAAPKFMSQLRLLMGRGGACGQDPEPAAAGQAVQGTAAPVMPEGDIAAPVDAPRKKSSPLIVEANETHAVLVPVSDFDGDSNSVSVA